MTFQMFTKHLLLVPTLAFNRQMLQITAATTAKMRTSGRHALVRSLEDSAHVTFIIPTMLGMDGHLDVFTGQRLIDKKRLALRIVRHASPIMGQALDHDTAFVVTSGAR
jgi:hypothetical protein